MGILDELHKLGVNPGDNAPISVSLDRLTTAVHQAAKNIYGECTVDDPFKAPTHGLNKDGVPMIIFEYWTRHKEQPNDKYRVFGSTLFGGGNPLRTYWTGPGFPLPSIYPIQETNHPSQRS